MKTPRLYSTLIASMILLATVSGLRADTIYVNSYANYSVTVSDASTAFNNTVGFNGSKASLGDSFAITGVEGAGYQHLLGSVFATFQADPGYVFTGVLLDFGQWAYSNVPFVGSHGGSGSWTVSGSTYVGDTNPVDPGISSMAWSGSGDSGSWNYYRYVDWDGGGGGFQSIMGPFGSYPIQLNNASSFTLTMNLDFWVHSNSGYGVSSLGVNTLITGAPPASEVPDDSSALVLISGGLAALGLFRRKLA